MPPTQGEWNIWVYSEWMYETHVFEMWIIMMLIALNKEESTP